MTQRTKNTTSSKPGRPPRDPQPVDVYVYRLTEKGPEFLLLKRSAGKIYANQWRMVGGKTEKSETRWQAALRELREETSLIPELFWCVPSINHFYDPRKDIVHLIPAFAVQVDQMANIVLDAEHTDYRWVDAASVEAMIHWPEQRRLMELILTILTRGEILPEWIIKTQ